ncbi:PP2C-like domain-containing protein CG9801 [Stylophora pistillata]|uniref:PP2C-like domain-containing protein CG9801 n=1 Tax=Stylophora pistillata TaxID=50429 RepID=A0A2B4SSU2_STYPI|nr:PP2C-like domain-containing protein CG9801 [Stylophora pistillata]
MTSPQSGVHWRGFTNRRDLPKHELVQMGKNICEAATGPGDGVKDIFLEIADDCEQISKWNTAQEPRRAFGKGTSLYHQDPVSNCFWGDPVADVYAVIARENSCILALADGVSWGEKSRLTARCAVAGCLQHLNTHLFTANTTLDIMEVLYDAFKNAHEFIIKKDGLLTTLCAAVVCPLKDFGKWGLCVLNVGDSLAFTYKKEKGVQEVTFGSHCDIKSRDMRCPGGSLGPYDGNNPDLSNLTFSFTILDTGDIVFLTSDGVSDNFDPVIRKKSLIDISAQAVCANLLLHVLACTHKKRQHREKIQARGSHNLYRREERIHQGSEKGTSQLNCELPGKLDHAAVVAFEVGLYSTDGGNRRSLFEFFAGLKNGMRRASSSY